MTIIAQILQCKRRGCGLRFQAFDAAHRRAGFCSERCQDRQHKRNLIEDRLL